jgi:hypothetical protein
MNFNMENNFEPISDAYQLIEGAIIRGKDQSELFELGSYDADKKGYTVYPYGDGKRFEDFDMLITETELMDNYLIETGKSDDKKASDDDILSDSL